MTGTTGPTAPSSLYEVDEVLGIWEELDLRVIPEEGGVMYFKDLKPMDHCVFFARRNG